MSGRARRLVAGAAVLALLLLSSACSDDGGDDGSELGVTSSTVPPTAPPEPSASPAGTGVVVIGELSSSFAVTECELAAPADGTAEGQLLRLTGNGTRANGVPFSVEVERSVVESDDATAFTDLITYVDSARILQAQRSETGGEITDLRDPDARTPLLRVRDDGLSATGIAGPPGTSAPKGPGLVGLALDATC